MADNEHEDRYVIPDGVTAFFTMEAVEFSKPVAGLTADDLGQVWSRFSDFQWRNHMLSMQEVGQALQQIESRTASPAGTLHLVGVDTRDGAPAVHIFDDLSDMSYSFRTWGSFEWVIRTIMEKRQERKAGIGA